MLTPGAERRLHVFAAAFTAFTLLWAASGNAHPTGLIPVLVWIALVPGWVVTAFVGFAVPLAARLAMAVAVSLALVTQLSSLALWFHAWQPHLILYALGGACFAGITVALSRSEAA